MTARERTYVTFQFQDREILLPSIFEASAAAMMSGNVLTIMAELVPNHDDLLADLTISEFGDFMAAWTKASDEARPKPPPTKPARFYRTAWTVFWLAVAFSVLAVCVASMFVDVPPAWKFTLIGLWLGHALYIFAAPQGAKP